MSFLDSFVEWANFNLIDNSEAIDYLLGRGVSYTQIQGHKLGYVSDVFEVDPKLDPNHDPRICTDLSRDYLWCDSCRFIRWSSLWIEHQDGFRTKEPGKRIINSIVLPLTDYSRALIGFQIRSIANKSYDTFILKYRPFGYFFGLGYNLDYIWKNKEVWLTEGCFDQLILERLITRNVLAITSNSIGRNQARFILRFVNTVYWCSDMDPAGREGFKKLVRFYGDKLDIRDIKYPKIKSSDGRFLKDPNDIWKEVGDAKFIKIFENLV